MSAMRFIDGDFTKGEPILCRDFINLQAGTVVWAKAATKALNGPFQILHRYEAEGGSVFPSFVITDADEMGINVTCPRGLSMDTNFGFIAEKVGQINIFQAVPVQSK